MTLTAPAATRARPAAPPIPGQPGSENARSPLSTREWHFASSLAGQNVLIEEVLAKDLPGSDQWLTDTKDNQEVSQVGTSDVIGARENPNRIALYVTNLGNVPIFALPTNAASSSRAYVIQGSGGFMRVVGNDVALVAPSSARAAPGDRNASNVFNKGNQTPGAAALASTTNWTYTVPAGRKCLVELLTYKVENRSTIALNGQVTGQLIYTPNGGGAQPVVELSLESGQASAHIDWAVGQSMTLYAGDVLKDQMSVTNNAAGTDTNLQSAFKGTEYDA